MKREELEALISNYLEGALSPADAEALLAEVRSSDEARRLLVRHLYHERTIQNLLAPAPATASRPMPRVIPPRRRRRPVRAWMLAAAALLGLSTIAYIALSPSGGEGFATVERIEGGVTAESAGLRTAIGSPTRFEQAVTLVTGAATGRARIQLVDGAVLEVGPASTLSLDPANAHSLRSGMLRADVRPRASRSPFVITTPQGEARILGTKFTLAVAQGATRLEVEQGTVRLTRLTDRKSAEVGQGQFAEAAATVEPVARSISALRIAGMAPNSWLSVPDSRLSRVLPDPARYPKIRGQSGPENIVEGWSGGAFDTRRNRLLVWGGGSTNYRGNELYAFSVETLRWERLTDPASDPADGVQANPDGTPNARATYSGLAYLESIDGLFSCGGDLGSSTRNFPIPPHATWIFDLKAGAWSRRTPGGTPPPHWVGNNCSYDAATRRVWWGQGLHSPGLYSYEVESNRWTKHNSDDFYYCAGALDSRRGLWLIVRGGEVWAYDLRKGDFARQAWRTTGGDGFLSKTNPGLEYDPVSDRFVGWAGGPVYVLDPETRIWTAFDAAGAPKATPNGIFGRWRLVPALGIFVVVTGIHDNVHFYKLPK